MNQNVVLIKEFGNPLYDHLLLANCVTTFHHWTFDMQPCILVLLGDTFTMLYVQYSVSASVALCGLCCLLRAAESPLLTQLRSSSRREGV